MSLALHGVRARVAKLRLTGIIRWRYLLAVLALILLGSVPAAAATIFVNWQNSGVQKGTFANPYQTLAAALAFAAPGDTIAIGTGSYNLAGGLLNKQATFRADNGPVTITNLFSDEWYTYRYNAARTGAQPYASDLSDPSKVGMLRCVWSFPLDEHCGSMVAGSPLGGFRASPIVVNDTVFIGSVKGYFYALDAATGALNWQYPPATGQALLGSCNNGGNETWGRYGIQISATYARIGGQDAVIFGAPDPSAEGGRGSARLFAFTLGGTPIWKSDIVAHLSGCTPGSLSEQHERIAYSSPLVLGNKVYVGVHDAGDDPVQVGRVIAVDLSTGHIVPSFQFQSVGAPASPPDPQCLQRCEDRYEECLNCDHSQPGCLLPSKCADGKGNCEEACRHPTTGRAGGVWNSLATDGEGVYFTTGNTRCDNVACQSLEPNPNYGLSMIRVDKDTGNIIWRPPFQPVPFNLDDDPDWAAGATVMNTSCGELIASVMKDGWSYAVDAGNGSPGRPSVRWQFPPTGYPFTDYVHTDTRYNRPGAAWKDVFVVRTGGESLVQENTAGYGKLHALNACATTEQKRVRWIADIPNTCLARPPSDPCHKQNYYSPENAIGAPTVTGGIVFIGTDLGHLIVLGDPSIVPGVGFRCSDIDYLTVSGCLSAGYALVPIPKVLADVAMPDGGDIAGLRDEPALARGRVFVGTRHCLDLTDDRCRANNGHVYMFEP